jgi:hypothetical protein
MKIQINQQFIEFYSFWIASGIPRNDVLLLGFASLRGISEAIQKIKIFYSI